jgi:glycosyltransferase involved in cell wall biosynthesis
MITTFSKKNVVVHPIQEQRALKQKVLMILHLPPPVHGASTVGKCIKESSSINNHFEIEYINLATSFTVDDIGKRGLRKLLIFIRIFVQVLQSVWHTKYNLYYFTLNSAGSAFIKDLLIVTILKLFRKKIIYHFHNKGVSKASDKWFANLLYKYAFYKTKSILLSPSLYGDYHKYLKPEDVYYCPNGIPVVRKILPTAQQVRKETKCILLFLSNMLTEKGVFTLLEACGVLKEKNIGFECHFVGDWYDISATYFRDLVREYNLSEEVFAHGGKYGEEKINFLLVSDIFVLPTFNDCFPLVLLEAMSYGLPVVSTVEGGIPDIVLNDETGFLVPPRDACSLAIKLEVLIKEPNLRRKFGEAGRKRFLDHFTIEKFEENFIKVLEQNLK